jgi:hypothetical protein
MRSTAYRACISLGAGCQTAYHIRRCLWQPEAYFFDWLATPMPALLVLLRGGLDGLFRDPGDFCPQAAPPSGHFPIRHRTLGVVSYHDLRRDEGWRDFSLAAAKYAALAERWRRTIEGGGPLLFVRHLIDRADAARLVDTLKEVYPDLAFSVLAVSEGDDPAASWELPQLFHTVVGRTPFEAIDRGDAGPAAWKGDAEGWQEAFRLAGAIR